MGLFLDILFCSIYLSVSIFMPVFHVFLFLFFFRLFLCIFREGGKERKRGRGSISVREKPPWVASHTCPDWGGTPNPGLSPDPESNQRLLLWELTSNQLSHVGHST